MSDEDPDAEVVAIGQAFERLEIAAAEHSEARYRTMLASLDSRPYRTRYVGAELQHRAGVLVAAARELVRLYDDYERAHAKPFTTTAPKPSPCPATVTGLCLSMTDGHQRCDEGECVYPQGDQGQGATGSQPSDRADDAPLTGGGVPDELAVQPVRGDGGGGQGDGGRLE